MNEDFINFKKFVDHVYHEFEQKVSLEEVSELLSLEDGYNRDSPHSTGRHLSIARLIFSGEKRNSEPISFDQSFHKGINVWIADNHKGKSTIFKIIKFVLTGRNKIKRDIQPWIEEILLEFNVGKVLYTCHVDSRGRARGTLFRFSIEEYQHLAELGKLDTVDSRTEFTFRSAAELERNMQEFFFDQFSFYSMKYTQKDSAKDSFALRTSNLSWATYYKSIYLESSNYEYLFFDEERKGAQGRKIFEMILGLPLTYPINALSLQRDRIKESIGKAKMTFKTKTERSVAEKKVLSNRLKAVKQQLKEIAKFQTSTFNEKPLIAEYDKLLRKINDQRKQERAVREDHENSDKKLALIEEELGNLKQDSEKVLKNISIIRKQENNLNLYREAGSFFTNLDIQSCPHCYTVITEERREKERDSHICGLCGETSSEQKVDSAEIEHKLEKLSVELNASQIKYQEIINLIDIKQKQKQEAQITRNRFYAKLVNIPSTQADSERLEQIEQLIDQIQQERDKNKDLSKRRDGLVAEEGILRFQLSKIESSQDQGTSDLINELQTKAEIIDFALSSLSRRRKSLNQKILNMLEGLIVDEIHTFGLTSIKKVEISDRYHLTFLQNGVELSFNELTEGEKLRVKLAFYLSLIQLDIEKNLGRHPRFLIFDSPGSEEMVPKHLHGLSKILKNVNDRYQDKLQIFVGSALREFAVITSEEKRFVREEDQFIF